MAGNPGSTRVTEKLGFEHIGETRCSSVARGGDMPALQFHLTRLDRRAPVGSRPGLEQAPETLYRLSQSQFEASR